MKSMSQLSRPLENENGFALVSVVLILAMLTFIGIAATDNTVFELKIAGNERVANQRFLVADSGWKQSGPYLNALATAPLIKNITLAPNTAYDWNNEYFQIVRNYGDGVDGTLNDNFVATTEDGAIANLAYWYRILYQLDNQAVEFGTNYREFQYGVNCRAQGNSEVDTRVLKVYRVGY